MEENLFGYKIRKDLFPGEDTYFSKNPHVTGMAAETGDIILNPHSPAGVNHDAVAKNEALRLLLREKAVIPQFNLTEEQQSYFQGTPYQGRDADSKATIAARIYSQDPSAKATTEQQQWVEQFVRQQKQQQMLDVMNGKVSGVEKTPWAEE